MADKKSFSQSRNLLIADADMISDQARHYLARAEAYDPPHWFHRRAADTFYEAATRYQEAGLGLMAKVLYGYAKDCYGPNGQPEESARCEALVTSVPVLWGEVRS